MTENAEKLTIAAQEADRLRTDPAFQEAVRLARAVAVGDLIACDPTNADAIRAAQARIWAIDQLCQELANIILRAPRKPLAVA